MSQRPKNAQAFGSYIDPKDIVWTEQAVRNATRQPFSPPPLVSETERKAALRRIYNRMRKEGHFPDPITEVMK